MLFICFCSFILGEKMHFIPEGLYMYRISNLIDGLTKDHQKGFRSWPGNTNQWFDTRVSLMGKNL